MRKLFYILLAAFLIPIGAYAQVFNQNQVINTPYGGFVYSPNASGGSKLQATSTPYFSNFSASAGTINGNFTVTGTCTGCGGSSSTGYPFTPANNYASLMSATTSPIWGRAGLYASSTSIFENPVFQKVGGNLIFFNLSAPTATRTFSFPDASGTFCLTSTCLDTVGNWFTPQANYNSTSTPIGFLQGLFSTASSTFNGPFRLSALTNGFLGVGNGLVYSAASSSLFGYIPEQPLTFTTPNIRTGNTINWVGLATTSQPSSSNVLTSNGGAGVYGTATTSVTCSGNATCSSFTVLGATPIVINVAAGTAASSTLLGDSNTFSGVLNKFSNPISISTFNGLIGANNGLTYAVSTSSLNASITGSAGSVANSVTFNNGGAGGASGSSFNGSGALTVSYNTIGAQVAGTYVTAVTGTANQITSSGGTTPTLSLPQSLIFPLSFTSTYGTTTYASSTAQSTGNFLAINSTSTSLSLIGGAANCNGTSALTTTASGVVNCTVQPQGTVTAVSVASANGFAGSSSGGATPALTLSTTLTSNVVKANGTALIAAVNGTDYSLITAKTCTAGDFVSSVTAAGVFTCTTPAGTTYTGTFPIQVTGSVISSLFSTTTNTGMAQGNLYVGSGGILQTSASSSIFGYVPEQPLTFTTPNIRTGNTINWVGLATTSQPASSNLLVSNGTAGVFGVATTTVTAGTGVSFSPFVVIGSSPITITASGNAGNWFTPTTNYGAGTNATNTPVWFQQGLQASSTSHMATTTLIALDQGGQVYNVKAYGAVGDGITDDTTAINTTLAKGGTTFFPAGTYLVTGLTLAGGAHMLGVGAGLYGTVAPVTQRSIIKLKNAANTNLINVPAGNSYGSIEHMEFDGNKANQSGSGAGNGINIADALAAQEAQWRLVDVEVYNASTTGIYIGNYRQAMYTEQTRVTASGNYGMYIAGSDGTYIKPLAATSGIDNIFIATLANVTRIVGGDVWSATGNGINISSTNNVTIEGTGIDHNGKNGITINGTGNVSLVGNIFHSNSQSANNTYSDVSVDSQISDFNTTIESNTFGPLDGGITNKRKYAVDTHGNNVLSGGNVDTATANGTGFTDSNSAMGYTSTVPQLNLKTLSSTIAAQITFLTPASTISFTSNDAAGGFGFFDNTHSMWDIFGNATNGRIGIGTSNPGAPLQVGNGTSAALSGVGLLIDNNSSPNGIQLAAFGDSTKQGLIQQNNEELDIKSGTSNSSSINFFTKGSQQMFIDPNGNVGIGTTTLSTKLGVQGNELISGTSTAGNFFATSTLTVKGLAASAGQCLTTNANGLVIAQSCGSGAAFPFTPLTDFAVNTSATGTPLWAQAGLFSSSTIQATNVNIDVFSSYRQGGNLLGYASSTNGTTIFGLFSGGQNSTTSPVFSGNTSLGYQTLRGNSTGTFNTAVGASALARNAVGVANTAVGYLALFNNATGTNNTSVGYTAGDGATPFNNSSGNTFIGSQAGFSITGNNADNNTALGFAAAANLTTGYGNTLLGSSVTPLTITTGNNNINIGAEIFNVNVAASNQINIGNLIYGTIPATSTTLASAMTKYGVVGIGTTTPRWTLQLASSTAPQIALTDPLAALNQKDWYIQSSQGQLLFGTTTDLSPTTTPAAIRISQGATTALGVATTSPWRTLSVEGTVAFHSLTTGTAGTPVCINTSGEIVSSGGTTCATSSLKTKHAVAELSTAESLADIAALKPVAFTFNESGDRRIGFIAEEVNKIDPRLVDLAQADTTFPDSSGTIAKGDPISVEYGNITALLVKAVQNIISRLTGDEKRIDAMQKQIDALNAKIDAMQKK